MSFISINRWDEYQHYKERSAPWIKLYRDMLDSQMWVMSSDASKLLAICLMLMALRNDNKIPADPEYIKRFGNLEFLPDFSELIKHGFIDFISENGECMPPASAMLATCPPEREQRRIEREQSRSEGDKKQSKSRAETEPKSIAPTALLASLGVSESVASDWIVLRKAKRLPVTQTVLDGIGREAALAGLSLQDALRISCERGWAGFKAAWLNTQGVGNGKSSVFEQTMDAGARAKARIFGGAEHE